MRVPIGAKGFFLHGGVPASCVITGYREDSVVINWNSPSGLRIDYLWEHDFHWEREQARLV